MNKFSAEEVLRIGVLMGSLIPALENPKYADPPLTADRVVEWIKKIHNECFEIELLESVKFTRRILSEFATGVKSEELKIKLDDLRQLIASEMESHLFLWVPPHRAAFYYKDAEAIVGAEFNARFPNASREITEAAKCYAVGRFTASAFHLMRATESAIKALGIAIGLTPSHPGWKLVLDEVWKQYRTPAARHSSWATHEPFFVTVSADLRAISKVWRNDIAHFVDTYNEEESKPMFEIVAAFLRDLATRIDENGTLF